MKKFLSCFAAVIFAFTLSCLEDVGGTLILPENDNWRGGWSLSDLPFQTGSIPSGSGNYLGSLGMANEIVAGGATPITFTSPTPLNQLYVRFDNGDGYYTLNLTSENLISSDGGAYTYEVIMPLPTDAEETLTLNLSGRATNGELSTVVIKDVNVKNVGMGYLQIMLTWSNNDDLDLYVTVPSGATIYYGNGTVGNGRLDMDALGCNSNNARTENIYFTAPLDDGDYKVEVKQHSRCTGSNGATYSVISRIGGQSFSFSANQNGRFTTTNSERVNIGTIRIRNGTVAR